MVIDLMGVKGAAMLAVIIITTVGVVSVAAIKTFTVIKNLRDRIVYIETHNRFLGHVIAGDELKHQASRGLPKWNKPSTSDASPGSWKKIAGNGEFGSWSEPHQKTKALAVHDGKLCAGLMGKSKGHAQVWCFDGSQWQTIGRFEGLYVTFLISHDGALYAGVDDSVWIFEDAGWRNLHTFAGCTAYCAHVLADTLYIGTTGCGLNIYRLTTGGIEAMDLKGSYDSYYGVYELHAFGGQLIAGAIAKHGTAAVFAIDGSGAIEKLGGDGVNGSWQYPGFTYPESLSTHRGNLVVTFNRFPMVSVPISPVWTFDGHEWYPVGRENMAPEWMRMNNFNASISFRGNLFVGGGGLPPGTSSVWRVGNEGSVKVGGGKINGSWPRVMDRRSGAEYVYRLLIWNDRMIAGFGDGPGLAQIWIYE